MFSNILTMIRQRRNRENLYATADYWDYKAATYNATSVSMWANQSLNGLYNEEIRCIIDRQIGNVNGLDVLDVGCGTGRMSRWFADRGAKVTGIDFSAGSLEIARKLSAGDSPQYRQCSIFKLAESQVYDLALTWGVLTFACRNRDELLDALIRIHRSLRPGGQLFLMEPVHSGFLHRVLNMKLADFLDVVQAAGFTVDATEPMHFWPMRLVLAYLRWPSWFTVPLYHLGQAAMKLPGLNRLGDYHMVAARPVAV